jgi:hypothetical protein
MEAAVIDMPTAAPAYLHIDRYDAIHDSAPPVTLIMPIAWKALNAALLKGMPWHNNEAPLPIAGITLDDVYYRTGAGAVTKHLLARPLVLYSNGQLGQGSASLPAAPLEAFRADTTDASGLTPSTLCLVLHNTSSGQMIDTAADAQTRVSQLTRIMYGRFDNRRVVLRVRSHWHDHLAHTMLRGANGAAIKSVHRFGYKGNVKTTHMIDEQAAALPGYTYAVHSTVIRNKERRREDDGSNANPDIAARLFPVQVAGVETVEATGTIDTPFALCLYRDAINRLQNGYQWNVLERARALVSMMTGSSYQFADPDLLARTLEEVMATEIRNAAGVLHVRLSVSFNAISPETMQPELRSVAIALPIRVEALATENVPDTDAFLRAFAAGLATNARGVAPLGFNIGPDEDKQATEPLGGEDDKKKKKKKATSAAASAATLNERNTDRLRARLENDLFMLAVRDTTPNFPPMHLPYVNLFKRAAPQWYLALAQHYYPSDGGAGTLPEELEKLIRQQIMKPEVNNTVAIAQLAREILAAPPPAAAAAKLPEPIVAARAPAAAAPAAAPMNSLKRARSVSPPSSPDASAPSSSGLRGRPPSKKARPETTATALPSKSSQFLLSREFADWSAAQPRDPAALFNADEDADLFLGGVWDDEMDTAWNEANRNDYDALFTHIRTPPRSEEKEEKEPDNNLENSYTPILDEENPLFSWPNANEDDADGGGGIDFDPYAQAALGVHTPVQQGAKSKRKVKKEATTRGMVADDTLQPYIAPFVTLLFENPPIDYSKTHYGTVVAMSLLFASQARWTVHENTVHVYGPFSYLLAGATPNDYRPGGTWKTGSIPIPTRGDWPGLVPEFILAPNDAERLPAQWNQLRDVSVVDVVYRRNNVLSQPLLTAEPPATLFFNVCHPASQRYLFPLPGLPIPDKDRVMVPHKSLFAAATTMAAQTLSSTQWTIAWPVWHTARLVKLAWRVLYRGSGEGDLILARAESISADHPIVGDAVAIAGMRIAVGTISTLVNRLRQAQSLAPLRVVNHYSNLANPMHLAELPRADVGDDTVADFVPLLYLHPALRRKLPVPAKV